MIFLKDVVEARERIYKKVNNTPAIRAYKLERLFSGAEIYLKLENMQITGSFKLRGATNKVMSMSREDLSKGIVAASSGNHAQAVAYASKKAGAKAVIVMPEDAPLVKINGTKSYGAEVILHGFTGDDREKKASELVFLHGYTFISSHADPFIIAGQGTSAMEFMEQVPDLDCIITPCGAGGLIAGTLVSVLETNKNIEVITVEPEGVPRMTESLRLKKPMSVPMGKTLADGLRVNRADDINYEIISKYSPKIILQDDKYILEMIREVLFLEKVLIEPSSAIVLAAMMDKKIDTSYGKKIGIIVTGGNIDGEFLKKILDK